MYVQFATRFTRAAENHENKQTTTTSKTSKQWKSDSHEQVFTVKENQKKKKDVIYFAVPFLPVEGKQASSVFLFCVL